jgi:hypothetical protein
VASKPRIKLDVEPKPWSEAAVARAIIHSQVFQRKLLIVPRCNWTGNECDLLAVTADLRLVDLEIKISRADLLADVKKDKWWSRTWGPGAPKPRGWPPKIWKHYYVLPAAIWRNELAAKLPANSGVLTLSDGPRPHIEVARRSRPNREAQKINVEAAVDIARLAGLRMWDALLREGKQ